MTNRIAAGLIVVIFTVTLIGCDSATLSSPTAPSTVQAQQPTPQPAAAAAAGMAKVTLSGVVFEVTPTGRVPIEGVAVYCEPCGVETHTFAYTDTNGFYSFFGVWFDGHPTRLMVRKDGFADPPGIPTPTPPNPSGPGWREVWIDGNTRFDVELVRQ